MADTKISALTDATALTDTDYLVMVDDVGGTPTTKRVDALDAKTYFTDEVAGDIETAQGEVVGINTQTGISYTLVLADAGKLVERNNGSAMTCTVPPNSSVAFPVNTVILVTRYGAGTLTMVAGSGVTLRGTLTAGAQYDMLTLIKRATDEWYVIGGS